MFRSKSVQPFERKKRTSKNTCHVPRARGTCNSRLGFFPPLNCVEWHLPGPDRTSRSGAINEFMKLRGTCLWHVPRAKCRRDTQKHSHPDGAYRPTNFEPNSSIGLACSVDDMFFFRVHAAARCVARTRGTNRTATGTIVFRPFRRVERTLAGPDQPSRSCSRCRGALDKISGRIIRPDNWFSDYPVSGRIFLVIRPDSRILKVDFSVTFLLKMNIIIEF